jgi:hypothetical protein
VIVGGTLPGTVSLDNANILEAGNLHVAHDAGVTGQVNHTDAGTLLNLSGILTAGELGGASITIRNSAGHNSGDAFVGSGVNSSGIIAISGAKSTWAQNGRMNLSVSGSTSTNQVSDIADSEAMIANFAFAVPQQQLLSRFMNNRPCLPPGSSRTANLRL